MTLADGLNWLDRHINLEATAGRIEGLSLERMHRLAEVLGDPQNGYPVIHITGTNGKGSTARMVTGLLAEAGLTVGTYTSPHLQRINERIARNSEPIDDEELAALLADLERLEAVVAVPNSYFELLTAAALRWFADIAVDVAVVEVGLLGRFDATNICDGVVAVVTNVGYDHTDGTGDWRARIAEEKSGIIKPLSTLVLGETDPSLAPIFHRAGAREIWERERDFDCESNELAVGGRLLELRTPSARYDEVYLSLHGAYQGDNAAVALAAAEAFFASPLSDDIVRDAFASLTMPGRFEVVGRDPLIVIDGAHSPEAAARVIETLHDDFERGGDTILVIGMLQPREVTSMLEALEVDTAAAVIACAPPSPRAIDPEAIAAAAEALGARVIVERDVVHAVERARELANPNDAILITGSLYVVGAARSHLLP
ncbi:MAG: dihydrofolate synthase / folylpolyglutamate synthase [Acidimicrobiaceae bacterium]|jgi:dihydrofolate synthase/folylpolyglutamate synthase